MTPPSRSAAAFFLAALLAAVLRAPAPPPPAFALPAPAQPMSGTAAFAAEPLPAAAPSAHAATLAELPDGRLAAAWFAGSREGAADVAIWFSRRDSGGWEPPRAVAERAATAAATGAHVRKLGNPVLYAEGERLHLWFVSAAVGGWAGSSINHSVSTDAGATWSPAAKLATSPFFNLSTLVRTPPLALADGGVGLPVYHEFIDKRGEWLRLDAAGRIVGRTRLAAVGPALQPALAALDGQRAVALLRNAGGGGAPQVLRADTGDAGERFSPLVEIAVGNPNSSLALLRLPSGRLLLAGNPGEGRNRLQLWVGDGEGRTWRASRVVEQSADGADEFSYPALLLARDGRIHLAYTWKRQAINHAAFDEAWLEAAP